MGQIREDIDSAAVEAAVERRILLAFPGHTASSLDSQSIEIAAEVRHHSLCWLVQPVVGRRNSSVGMAAQSVDPE